LGKQKKEDGSEFNFDTSKFEKKPLNENVQLNQFLRMDEVKKAEERISRKDLWPNFFIAGAPRSGTTSLYEYLKIIPGIYMSPIKEPNYFCKMTTPDDHVSKPVRKKEEYLGLFSEVKDETIMGEASVWYLSDPEAPKLIHSIVPHSRILISLRDPIERTYAAYLARFRKGILKGSFHDELPKAIEHWDSHDQNQIPLRHSLYAADVKRYLDIFGSKQVKIIIFEEFIKNIKNAMEEILRFLVITQDISHLEFQTAYNQSIVSRSMMLKNLFRNNKVKKVGKIFPTTSKRYFEEKFLYSRNKPTMLKEDKENLVQFFSNDVKKLQTLLCRTIPWPNFIK